MIETRRCRPQRRRQLSGRRCRRRRPPARSPRPPAVRGTGRVSRTAGCSKALVIMCSGPPCGYGAEDRQVVGFGAAAGEDDLCRAGADQSGDFGAARLERLREPYGRPSAGSTDCRTRRRGTAPSRGARAGREAWSPRGRDRCSRPSLTAPGRSSGCRGPHHAEVGLPADLLLPTQIVQVPTGGLPRSSMSSVASSVARMRSTRGRCRCRTAR